MQPAHKPTVAITMGDPCGIGPEIIAKTMTNPAINRICFPVVIGSHDALAKSINLIKAKLAIRKVNSVRESRISPGVVNLIDPGNLDPNDITVGQLSRECGRASVEWVTKAATLIKGGEVDAMVTAPINKNAASLAGYTSVGHMEILQRLSGAPNVATMLISGHLRVVHLTTHKPLKDALLYVKKELIGEMLELINTSMGEWGVLSPIIGVASINPHAGDGGLLGTEEQMEIQPAIEAARNKNINAVGPISSDILFHQAIQGVYDVTLAMYHDQGHIPIKVHGFERSVSINLGLPFLRTSVDHGTAFDIAGKGIAKNDGLIEAIYLAVNLLSGKGLTAGCDRSDAVPVI